MFGIALGSGFSGFVDHFTIQRSIPFDSFIDHLPVKVDGHARELLLAESNGQRFLIFSGKLHYYEGLPFETLIAPYQFAIHEFGMNKLIVTSASGGLQADVQVGEWQQIVNVIPFPGFSKQFDFQDFSANTADTEISTLPQRVYAFQQGPSLGTPAEYRALQRLGADLVGMSIHAERMFLSQTSLDVWYWSLPVVKYVPLDNYEEPSHAEVLAVSNNSVERLVGLFSELLNQ